jgi:predicted CoA-binding protein
LLYNACEILKEAETIAVVGISDKPHRTSYRISHFLVRKGYNVFGVNPLIENSGSIKVYPSLSDIPVEIDIVNVFRKSEKIAEIADEIIKAKPKVLWLQLGIVNFDVINLAEENGIKGIQDQCIKVRYSECFG